MDLIAAMRMRIKHAKSATYVTTKGVEKPSTRTTMIVHVSDLETLLDLAEGRVTSTPAGDEH